MATERISAFEDKMRGTYQTEMQREKRMKTHTHTKTISICVIYSNFNTRKRRNIKTEKNI